MTEHDKSSAIVTALLKFAMDRRAEDRNRAARRAVDVIPMLLDDQELAAAIYDAVVADKVALVPDKLTITIAGPQGSGKTYLANHLENPQPTNDIHARQLLSGAVIVVEGSKEA